MIIMNFNEVVKTFLKKHNEEGLIKLTKLFEEMEQKFHNTLNTKLWHVKGWRQRRVWTPIGDLTINRRIYDKYPRVNNGSKILFDKYLGLEPYQYLQSCFYQEFVMCLNKVYSYKTISEIFNHNFSTSTISKVLKTQKMELVPKNIQKETEILILNVDDIYVLSHKQKKIPIRSVIAYTGRDSSGSRNKLINKTLIPIDVDLSVPNQVRQLERTLKHVYGRIKKVIIVGDGANWITSYKNYFTNSETKRFIDKFHYKKHIKDLLGRKVKVDWEYFISLTKDEVWNYLHYLAADQDGVINFKNPKLLGKVMRWFNSFKNVCKENIPSCIEGIQSHFIARHLKTRRSFSKENLYKILMINVAEYNGWTINFDATKTKIFNFLEDQNIDFRVKKEQVHSSWSTGFCSQIMYDQDGRN